MTHRPPKFAESAFDCPHCQVFASQKWQLLLAKDMISLRGPTAWSLSSPIGLDVEKEVGRLNLFSGRDVGQELFAGNPVLMREKAIAESVIYNGNISQCFSCKKIAVWVDEVIIYPKILTTPAPNPDLPIEVSKDYIEASIILNDSPRGAAALLRLAMQKLCKELGGSGENLNKDIAELVSKGLDIRVQKALDAVRVIGNDLVHPGCIDQRDDRDLAYSMFGLINLIAEKMITEPAHIDSVYNSLPAHLRQAIDERATGKRK